jgi:hypothetical protein
MHDRCTVGAEHAIGSKIVLGNPMELLGTWVKWKLISVRLETVLVSSQDRGTVCAKHAIRLEIISGAPDGTYW